MKKSMLLAAALLPCFLAYSQEADDGNYLELTVPVRAEGDVHTGKSEDSDFSLENSSVYTLFEGALSGFSWTVSAHWFQGCTFSDFFSNTKDLYDCLGYSDTNNALDYFLLSYTAGNFTVSLGKDMLRTGGGDFDEWDWNVDAHSATLLWNELAAYQWGGSVTWDFAENNAFTFQLSNSPYNEKPFKENLLAYSGQYRFENDRLLVLASASALQVDSGEYEDLFAAGASYAVSDALTLTADVNNFASRFHGKVSAEYAVSERVSLEAAANAGSFKEEGSKENYFYGSLGALWLPIKNNSDLRLFAHASYSNISDDVSIGFGLRYDLHLLK